jgi:hypothetical protein
MKGQERVRRVKNCMGEGIASMSGFNLTMNDLSKQDLPTPESIRKYNEGRISVCNYSAYCTLVRSARTGVSHENNLELQSCNAMGQTLHIRERHSFLSCRFVAVALILALAPR